MSGARRGFTWVELLVCGGVLLVSAGLLVPAVSYARRASARAGCASNQRLLIQALQVYAADNGRSLPPANAWHPLLAAKLGLDARSRLLACPSARSAGVALPGYAADADFLSDREHQPDLPTYYSPKIDKVGPLYLKVFLMDSPGPTLLPPPYLQISGLLTGSAADPAASMVENESQDLLRYARHGTVRYGQPLTSYLMNVAFFDGHVDTLPILDAFAPDFHSPSGSRATLTFQTVYPRIIQKLGREQANYTIP
jgi:prepilin-type processing-associated H-X9-DG protein